MMLEGKNKTSLFPASFQVCKFKIALLSLSRVRIKYSASSTRQILEEIRSHRTVTSELRWVLLDIVEET